MGISPEATNHDEWEITSWGNLVELKYGKALKGYRESAGAYPVYGTNGPVGWCDKPLCEYPSVIVGRKGAYRGIHYSPIPFFVIDTAFFISPKANINLKWAYYALLLEDINGMDSGSAIPSTSRDDFYALTVKVPPRYVQDQIVQQLDVLNDKIELNRQMNETLEAMAQALFKSWFVDFDPVIDNALAAGNDIPEPLQKRAAVRQVLGAQRKSLPADVQSLFPDCFVLTDEMGWVPECWELKTFSELADIIMGQSPKGDSYNQEGIGLPLLNGAADFCDGVLKPKKFTTDSKREAMEGDLVFCIRATIGLLTYTEREFSLGRGVAAIRAEESFKEIIHQSLARQIERMKRAATGSVILGLKKEDIEGLSVLIGGRSITDVFHSQSEPLYKKIVTNTREIESLSRIRDTLLPKLLTGELRIADAEQQMAEAL